MNQDFLKTKETILSQTEIVRFVTTIDQIVYKEAGYFFVGDLRLKVNSSAFDKFLLTLNLGKNFINNLLGLNEGSYTPEESFRFVYNAVKIATRKASVAKKKVVVVYHVNSKCITNIYEESKIFLNVPSYLDLMEKILNRGNIELRSFFQNIDGTITLSYIDKSWDFSLGSTDEVFRSGLEYNYMNTHMKVNFFNLRMVCTNGMVTTDKISSRTVEGSSQKIPEFIEEVTSKAFSISCREAFNDHYKKAFNAQASLNEVLRLKDAVSNSFKVTPDKLFTILNSSTSYYKIVNSFSQEQVEDKDNLKFYRTPLTKWDLVNEITAISSSIERGLLVANPSVNRNLQVNAGKILMAPNDLGPKGLKQIF
jgi:hypothetical protein